MAFVPLFIPLNMVMLIIEGYIYWEGSHHLVLGLYLCRRCLNVVVVLAGVGLLEMVRTLGVVSCEHTYFNELLINLKINNYHHH